MAKLYLRLENDDGSFREYRKDKVKAYWVKEALKHSQKVDELNKKDNGIGVLEERLRFTCEVFGDKDLTPESILNGMEADELFQKLDEIYWTVMGRKEEAPAQGKP